MRTWVILHCLLVCFQSLWAQTDEFPNLETALHDAGKMRLSVQNFGGFGSGHEVVEGGRVRNITLEFPKGSYLRYMGEGAIWIGGIVGRDTLVSAAGVRGSDRITNVYGELMPDVGDAGRILYRSIMSNSPYHHRDAVSEQDFVCIYTDTVTGFEFIPDDGYDGRPHLPMHVRIRQSSYVWSFDYAEDFVIFDYAVKNIGLLPIKELYIGILVEPDGHTN